MQGLNNYLALAGETDMEMDILYSKIRYNIHYVLA